MGKTKSVKTKSKEVVETADELDEADEADDVGHGAPKGAAVDIVDGNRYIRTYSAKVHGKSFMASSEEFCSPLQLGGMKHGRKIVPAGKIRAVKVVWNEEVVNKETKERAMQTLERVFSVSDGSDFKDLALELASANKGTVLVV